MQQPKLTFIHGFMGHSSDWDDIRGGLNDFETRAIDVGVAKDWRSSLEQIAASIPDSSIIVGYSMGARLALGIAIELPEKCDGLIFISGNPGLESENDRQQRLRSDQQIADRIENEPLDKFLQQWYLSDVFCSVPDQIRAAEIESKQNRSPEHWPSILRAHSVALQPNYWPRLTHLSTPTLIVAGETDEKYRQIAVRMKQECSPGDVETRILPNCGHIVHREQPDMLIELIRKFCGESSTPT